MGFKVPSNPNCCGILQKERGVTQWYHPGTEPGAGTGREGKSPCRGHGCRGSLLPALSWCLSHSGLGGGHRAKRIPLLLLDEVGAGQPLGHWVSSRGDLTQSCSWAPLQRWRRGNLGSAGAVSAPSTALHSSEEQGAPGKRAQARNTGIHSRRELWRSDWALGRERKAVCRQ